MKLKDLVNLLRDYKKIHSFINDYLPNVEFDLVEVYMRERLDIESDIEFFNAEAIPGTLEINFNDNMLISLFSLYFIQEIVDEVMQSKIEENDDTKIAKLILELRLNDA